MGGGGGLRLGKVGAGVVCEDGASSKPLGNKAVHGGSMGGGIREVSVVTLAQADGRRLPRVVELVGMGMGGAGMGQLGFRVWGVPVAAWR